MGRETQERSGAKEGVRQPPDRVILTGYRATGKTVVGNRVAELLGRCFIDTDAELEARIGSSVADLVDKEGWPVFRRLEKELLAELAGKKGLVIATGGGAIQHEREWKDLRRNSLAVWLKADVETIRRRIEADKASGGQRPSLTGKNTLDEIEAVLAEREPSYRKGSDIQIDTAGRSPEELALLIKQRATATATP